jgi:DNA-binding beta-propeller fold protein YncE
VVKFDTEGRVALVLGRKPETIAVRAAPAGGRGGGEGGRGAEGGRGGGEGRGGGLPGAGIPGSTFNRPTDVAWDRAGNIYIADGIGNTNRVAKLDKEGRFIRQWGSTGAGNGQFAGVKSLAIDAQGNVYAADAGNKRIQVFDADGNYKSQFAQVGTPQTLCITGGPTQYLYVSHSGDPNGMDDAAIYKVQLDGRIVGKFGSAGRLLKQFGLANSIDCRNENELLVGEMINWRVQKVTLRAAR